MALVALKRVGSFCCFNGIHYLERIFKVIAKASSSISKAFCIMVLDFAMI